jgi:hypothetical protein
MIMYEEKGPFSLPIIVLLLGSIALLGTASILAFIGIYNLSEASVVLVLVTVILALAAWSFFNMRFRITSKGVEASMFPFTHKVSYDNIKDVHIIDKIPWYVGWGLRVWGRRLAFVTMHKKAVAIEKKKGIFKTLVMTTSDPEKFIERINTPPRK